MKSSGKYLDLWTKHRELIYNKLLIASTRQTIQLEKKDFENVGNRVKSKYSFNLEFKDGVIFNDISGTAVARDLAKILLSSEKTKASLQLGHHKINMDRNFCLWIVKLAN